MSVNKAALDLICEFEGFVPNWYPDPAHGWKVPTCCYGHTDAAGEPKYAATKDKTFTEAEGRGILLRDLVQYEEVVRKAVTAKVTENQVGALTSLTFNVGPSNFLQSTLLRTLNAGDHEGAAEQFARWNKAGGQVLAGLTRRRAAEAALFRSAAKSGPAPTPAKRGFWRSVQDFFRRLFRKG